MNQAETFQIEPPQRESSGSGRLLLGIGIGCGIMAVICCGGVAGLSWWAYDFFQNAISADPVEIAANTERIATLEIPERLEPQMSIRLNPPFTGEIGTMVLYGSEAGQEMLMLGDFRDVPTDDRPPSEIFRELNPEAGVQIGSPENQVDLAPAERDPAFEESSREQLERPLRGGTARFEIIQGTNTETDQERIIVYGTFPGRLGGGIFMLNVNAENSSLEDVKQVIESLE